MATSKDNYCTTNNKDYVNILYREDFDSGPVSVDEIEPGLFLGNLAAATHMETRKNLKITYILTMDSVPLPAHIVQAPFLTTKYLHVSDMPKEDILHHFDECIDFINLALNNNQNILVHCYFGVSRSASIVIAYMMKKYNLEYLQAFERVRMRRRFVQPNPGFDFQLRLYRRMGCKIDLQYPKYKTYRLRLAADKVRKAKILPQSCMDVIKPDPGVMQENPEPIVYRCRKCRRILANKSYIITHTPKILPQIKENDNPLQQNNEIKDRDEGNDKRLIEQISENMRRTSVSEKSSENEEEIYCKGVLFVEPIAWMKEILNQTQGRLNCPKCTQKLGSFSWINGCHCPCGVEISPAFYLVPSKIELSHVVQNVQVTV